MAVLDLRRVRDPRRAAKRIVPNPDLGYQIACGRSDNVFTRTGKHFEKPRLMQNLGCYGIRRERDDAKDDDQFSLEGGGYRRAVSRLGPSKRRSQPQRARGVSPRRAMVRMPCYCRKGLRCIRPQILIVSRAASVR